MPRRTTATGAARLAGSGPRTAQGPAPAHQDLSRTDRDVLLRARAPERALEWLEVAPDGSHQWSPLGLALDVDADGRPVVRQVDPDRGPHRRTELLARATRLLDTPLDLEATIWQTGDLVVGDLADWCLVEVTGADQVRRCVLAHRDPEQLELAGQLSRPSSMTRLLGLLCVLPALTPVDLRTARLPGLGRGHREVLAAMDASATVAVPLTAAGRPVGSMLLVTSGGRPLPADVVELAVELGRRAGSAAEKARLYAELQESTRVLQASLLPPTLPSVPGVRLSAHYRSGTAGSDISGDYYDVFRTAPDRWWVALGDVCGKGPAAAALSAAVRHSLHAIAPDTDDPATVLRRLNDVLLAEEWDGRFTTLSLLTFRDEGGRGPLPLRIASGGHPAPMLRAADGSVRGLDCPGTLVGALPQLRVETVALELGPGETLLLYTDGVTEARDPAGVELGEDTLATLLAGRHGHDVGELAADLAFEVLKLADGELRDDLALLTLTR